MVFKHTETVSPILISPSSEPEKYLVGRSHIKAV